MDAKQLEDEQRCLKVKYLCDLLRTQLFMMDGFKNYEHYAKKLKEIKAQVDKIYWSL